MRSRFASIGSVALIASSLLLAAPASSQDYARSGFYAGAGVIGGVYTEIDDELEDFLLDLGYAVDVDTDAAVGFDVYGGYRLHPNFAVEADAEFLSETDLEIDGFGEFAELEAFTFTGNVKAFPLTGRVQPFLLMGIGLMSVEVEDTVGLGFSESETGFAARFGGGVDFYVTENIVISGGLKYLLPTGDVDELDYVSFGAGVQYRF